MKKNKNFVKFKRGLTVVEVIIVIAILMIISGIVLTSSTSSIHAYELSSATNALSGPDVVLRGQLGNTNVLRCPSDRQQLFEETGSSYAWNSLLNGQRDDNLNVFGLRFDPHAIPLMYDKEDFHKARGSAKAVNYLYADGHIKNLLAIEGTLQK